MEYSKIESIAIKNFRNIKDVKIGFKESPIVTLIGENEAGKTSIVKAFCVASLNGYQMKQKNYIKDGTSGFGVEIRLEDGSILQRIKTKVSNQVVIKRADGSIWQATKIDKGGVIKEVQDIMGLIEEPETKEYLQVRTYEDQLLFVVTSGSTNYKVMYDALKVEQLTKALKLGTEEANSLKRDIDKNTDISKALGVNMRSIKVIDLEPLSNIKDRLKRELNIIKMVERVQDGVLGIKRIEDELGVLVGLKEARSIGLEEVSILKRVRDSVKRVKDLEGNIGELRVLEGLSEVESKDYSKVLDLVRRVAEYKGLEAELGVYKDIELLEEIDYSKVRVLKNMGEKVEIIRKIEGELDVMGVEGIQEIKSSSIEKIEKLGRVKGILEEMYSRYKELQLVDKKVKEINGVLIESGAVVVECPNCGEMVVVDTNGRKV